MHDYTPLDYGKVHSKTRKSVTNNSKKKNFIKKHGNTNFVSQKNNLQEEPIN